MADVPFFFLSDRDSHASEIYPNCKYGTKDLNASVASIVNAYYISLDTEKSRHAGSNNSPSTYLLKAEAYRVFAMGLKYRFEIEREGRI